MDRGRRLPGRRARGCRRAPTEPREPGLGDSGRGHAGGARHGPAASGAPARGRQQGAGLDPSSREVLFRFRRGADGAFAGRPPPRVSCPDVRGKELAVGAATQRDGHSAARRHGRCGLSLLVPRQPLPGILCGRQAQKDRRLGRAPASPLRRPEWPRRNLESRRRDPLFSFVARRPPPAGLLRGRILGAGDRARCIQAGVQPPLPLLPAGRPAFPLSGSGHGGRPGRRT